MAKKRPASPPAPDEQQPAASPPKPRIKSTAPPKPAGQSRPAKKARPAGEPRSAGTAEPPKPAKPAAQPEPQQGHVKPHGQQRPQGQAKSREQQKPPVPQKPQGEGQPQQQGKRPAKRSSQVAKAEGAAQPAKQPPQARPPKPAEPAGSGRQRKSAAPRKKTSEPEAAGQAQSPPPSKSRQQARPPARRGDGVRPGRVIPAPPTRPPAEAAPAGPYSQAPPEERRPAKPPQPAAAPPREATPPREAARSAAAPKPAAPKPAKLAAPKPAKPAAPPAKPQPPAPPFGELQLSKAMLRALHLAGYTEPTPIQAGLIPKALDGIDVMGQARTGTGKTAAFAIPIIELIEEDPDALNPVALVLVPTRELAVQTRDEFLKLSVNRKLRITAVYGGKPIRAQTTTLRQGVDIIVGTPGRVLDHMGRRTLDLRDVEFVVLDEADRMLDIGFRPDIEKILRQCPSDRQTLLLSATIPPPVQRLAQRYMHDPETVDFSPTQISVETIDQHYFTVDAVRKFELLVRLIERESPRQAIIFCRTKRGSDKVHDRLSRKFNGVGVIHGDLPQPQRDRVMREFRDGSVRYLVATDVVGRGIDVTSISHIINYDIPEFCDDYVHRVGRTGRMGREGVAYTFVTPAEGNELTRIEVRINRQLQRDEMPDFAAYEQRTAAEPAEEPEAKPVFGRAKQRFRRAL